MNVPDAEQVKRPQENGAAEIAIKTPSLDAERSGKGVLPETLTFTPAYETTSEQTNGVGRMTSHGIALDRFGDTWSSSSSSEKVQLERYQGRLPLLKIRVRYKFEFRFFKISLLLYLSRAIQNQK